MLACSVARSIHMKWAICMRTPQCPHSPQYITFVDDVVDHLARSLVLVIVLCSTRVLIRTVRMLN